MRTGAIGGVAIKHLARPDASRAAILGSGRQARTHLEAAAVVRHFASVKVYSPNATHREAFASEMRETLDLNVVPFYQHKRLSRMPMWSFASPRAPHPCSIPAGSNPAPTSTPSGPEPRARANWTPASRGESGSSPQT